MVDRTTKEKQQANLHVQKLVHNPGALRKSLREENADTTRTQSLLKMLPDAFNFSYEDHSAGDLVKLKFSPNPHFRPPSRKYFMPWKGNWSSTIGTKGLWNSQVISSRL